MADSTDTHLSLDETLRIMDVAAELRDQRTRAQRELALAEVKEQLQENLLNTAQLTGETLTVDDVEAAIQLYFDNLHAFHEPQAGLSTFAAHLYIRRTWLLLFCLTGLVLAGGVWLLVWSLSG